MKKFIFLLTIIVSFSSCKIQEKPEFLRVENIQVIQSDSENIMLQADAFFNNPNTVGGKIETEGIKVVINDIEVATVSSKEFNVPARKEFSVPLVALVATKKVLNLNNLSGILNSVLNKGMQVQYKGEIKYKVFGFSHKYTLDEIQDVKIKI